VYVGERECKVIEGVCKRVRERERERERKRERVKLSENSDDI
jgi:hypothetical protein